ncbi:MAG: LLM class F420-dependent oxidoreductase [Hyphomicrobiaceae bacterium]
MKLGLLLRYDGEIGGPNMDLVLEAEKLGFESVWTGESYGTDSVTPAAWVLSRTTRIKAGTGIMQIPGRTPACAAMTAMTLQAMSNNRFLLGVGPSGPQVVEGWHGVPYGKPLARTKEYIEIIRKILDRTGNLEHQSEHYQIPYKGPGATGLGKPIRSIVKAQPGMKIYTAAIAPAGLRTAGEVGDGVLPIYLNPEKTALVVDSILEGRVKAGKPKNLDGFDIAPYVRMAMGPDLQKCRDSIKPQLALYIGGMGAREKNFYNDYAKRLGYEAEAVSIQDHFLAGRRNEAAAAVPDKLIDEIALVGPADRIKGRLKDWKAASGGGRIGTMLVAGADMAGLRVLAEGVA